MKKQLFIAAALTLATTACTTHHIQYKNPTLTAGGETKSVKQSFFLWGLAGGSEIDLARVCPNGVAAIDSTNSGLDHILTALTGGLYSPLSVEVKCAGGTQTAEGAR
jgi:hypothetical protein